MKCLLPYKCIISLPGVMFGFVKGDLPPRKKLKERAIQRQILKKKKKKSMKASCLHEEVCVANGMLALI